MLGRKRDAPQDAHLLAPGRMQSVEEILAGIALNESEPLPQQIYAALRKLAVELVLLPNQFLSEMDVATALAVSRTPVREAFIRLLEDGVIRVTPKSGTYVSVVDFREAEEGFFIWGALESSCVASLAEQRSLRNVGMLRELVSDETTAADRGDFAAFRTANNAFHDAVFDLADFPEAKRLTMLVRFDADRVRNILHSYRRMSLTSIAACHGRVVTAVAVGDAETAEAEMAGNFSELRLAMRTMMESEDFPLFHEFLNQKRAGKRRPRSAKGPSKKGNDDDS